MEEVEIWKPIEGFSRYEISTIGVVREVKSLREIPQLKKPIKHGKMLR